MFGHTETTKTKKLISCKKIDFFMWPTTLSGAFFCASAVLVFKSPKYRVRWQLCLELTLSGSTTVLTVGNYSWYRVVHFLVWTSLPPSLTQAGHPLEVCCTRECAVPTVAILFLREMLAPSPTSVT